MIETYLASAYQDGGRGPDVFDCWGLVRDARHRLLGKPLLPSYGDISADDKPALTQATKETAVGFQHSPCVEGAIATAWERGLCTHIGLVLRVDRRPMILETNKVGGARLTSKLAFERRFARVVYWND